MYVFGTFLFWQSPWVEGHLGRTPASVCYVVVFYLLGYKTVRAEPWGPERG